MNKFKVGDVVGYMGTQGITGPLTISKYGAPGEVWFTKGTWMRETCLFLWEEPQDDVLPPAPESVLYVNEFQWGVQANSLGDVLQVGVGDPNNPKHGWTYASLDADTALQLSHDLNRMANEIKRKDCKNT